LGIQLPGRTAVLVEGGSEKNESSLNSHVRNNILDRDEVEKSRYEIAVTPRGREERREFGCTVSYI
jgi:phage baseplate assembly protein W